MNFGHLVNAEWLAGVDLADLHPFERETRWVRFATLDFVLAMTLLDRGIPEKGGFDREEQLRLPKGTK